MHQNSWKRYDFFSYFFSENGSHLFFVSWMNEHHIFFSFSSVVLTFTGKIDFVFFILCFNSIFSWSFSIYYYYLFLRLSISFHSKLMALMVMKKMMMMILHSTSSSSSHKRHLKYRFKQKIIQLIRFLPVVISRAKLWFRMELFP